MKRKPLKTIPPMPVWPLSMERQVALYKKTRAGQGNRRRGMAGKITMTCVMLLAAICVSLAIGYFAFIATVGMVGRIPAMFPACACAASSMFVCLQTIANINTRK